MRSRAVRGAGLPLHPVERGDAARIWSRGKRVNAVWETLYGDNIDI